MIGRAPSAPPDEGRTFRLACGHAVTVPWDAPAAAMAACVVHHDTACPEGRAAEGRRALSPYAPALLSAFGP